MNNLRVELPIIQEAWQEACVLYAARIGAPTFPPRRDRWTGLARTLKTVRVLVSLEEVYGTGLLERFNKAQDMTDSAPAAQVVSRER